MAESRGCAALVLAAGSSTRLGQPKQLVDYGGEPLLRRAVRLAVEAGAQPVIAVVGAHAEGCRTALAGLPATVVENEDHASGMGGSLQIGMAVIGQMEPLPQRVLLLVCDQPLLQVEHLQQLLQAPGSVAAAEYGGHPGVPVVFRREHFSALASVTGDRGARALLRELPVATVPMPEAAADIDTPADLARLRSLG